MRFTTLTLMAALFTVGSVVAQNKENNTEYQTVNGVKYEVVKKVETKKKPKSSSPMSTTKIVVREEKKAIKSEKKENK